MDELKILIVEGNSSTAQELTKHIKKIGCKLVKTVTNVRVALQYIERAGPDAVISNVIINDESEVIQLINRLKRIKLPVIFISSTDDSTILQLAEQAHSRMGNLVQSIKSIEFRNTLDYSLKRINNKKKVK